MDIFKKVKHLLFLDIETAACASDYESLPERLQPEWDKKSQRWDDEASSAELFDQKAALFPEFGKIITIGVGYFHLTEEKELSFRVKAIAHEEESAILNEFKTLIQEKFNQNEILFVAHNGKSFDFPYICRRMLVNGISLPKSLDLYGKRPWQIPHLDTMEMWRFGDIRTYTSLELLASIFNIPSSKANLDGSQVSKTYHEGGNLERIAEYCQNDVIVTAKIYLKLKTLPDLDDNNIIKL